MADWGPGDLGGLQKNSRGEGVFDGNPIAIALFIFMVFVLLIWMGQPGGPLVNCQVCQGNVAKFFSANNQNTSWMLYLVVPLGMGMFVTYFIDQIAEQDEGTLGVYARQFQRTFPQAGLRQAIQAATLPGVRREFREGARQETRRAAEVTALRAEREQQLARLQRLNEDLAIQRNQPGLSSGARLQLDLRIENVNREIERLTLPVSRKRLPRGVREELAAAEALPAVSAVREIQSAEEAVRIQQERRAVLERARARLRNEAAVMGRQPLVDTQTGQVVPTGRIRFREEGRSRPQIRTVSPSGRRLAPVVRKNTTRAERVALLADQLNEPPGSRRRRRKA